MKLANALRIGLDVLAGFEVAKATGTVEPQQVNWTWSLGKWRFRLKGFLSAERVD